MTISNDPLGTTGIPGQPEVAAGSGVSSVGGSTFAGSETVAAITSINTFGFRGVSESETYISSDPIIELQINILNDVGKESAIRLDGQMTFVPNIE